jgi:hypothetical protein
LPKRQSRPPVIAGLDPAIHDEVRRMQLVRFSVQKRIMDARVKPAHDRGEVIANKKAP